MIITIIAEQRSGSTNLANWFNLKKSFTVLYEPISNSNTLWFKNNTPPSTWEYTTEHLMIKEIYQPNIDFTELVNISDKVIVLYREDSISQSYSWANAIKTDNWDNHWIYDSNLIQNLDLSDFISMKEGIKNEYLNKNYFKISYEELYYNDGFQKIVDYLNIDGIYDVNFPYGKKYRIDKKINSLL